MNTEHGTRSPLVIPLWILALFSIGCLLHYQANLFIWITCSLLLYVLIDPWYLFLRKKRFSSLSAAALLVLAATAVTLILVSLLLYISTDAYQELESSKKIFFDYYNSLFLKFKQFISSFAEPTTVVAAKDAVTGKTIPTVQVVENSPITSSMGTTLLSSVSSIMEILVYVFLWPILTFFMLSERDFLARKFKYFFKDDFDAETAWTQIVTAANAYFFGNLILLVITIPLFISLFLLFSIDNFITLAILAAIINTLPFLGAVLTGILPALQVLGETGTPILPIWIYILCFGVHFLMANFVTPKLLGARVNLNATTSTIALMAWSLMWGAMGLLLAIPLTAMIKILLECSSHPHMKWIAELMENPRPQR